MAMEVKIKKRLNYGIADSKPENEDGIAHISAGV